MQKVSVPVRGHSPKPPCFISVLAMDPRDILIVQGIELHPGPPSGPDECPRPANHNEDSRGFQSMANSDSSMTVTAPAADSMAKPVQLENLALSFQNCTHAWNYRQELGKIPAHGLFITEPSLNPGDEGKTATELSGYGWTSLFTSTDVELRHNTGGVGALARRPFRVFELKPKTVALQGLINKGRCGLYGLDIGGPVHAVVFVVYGWTGGHNDPSAAARTNDLVACFREESDHWPGLPQAMFGDFNATPSRLPDLQLMIDNLGWCDVGAVASRWGWIDCEVTCKANSATNFSSSDLIVTNQLFTLLIKGFSLSWDSFPVHATLLLQLDTKVDFSRTTMCQDPSMNCSKNNFLLLFL